MITAYIVLSIITIIVLIGVIVNLRIKTIEKSELIKVKNHDSLTGLMSMEQFRKIAKKKIAENKSKNLQLISVDIDMFRVVNDYFGFDTGSEVIKATAMMLDKAFSGREYVARENNDVFLILCEDSKERRIKNTCELAVLPAIKTQVGKNFHASLSVGICQIEGDTANLNALIDRANQARVLGKNSHNTTYHYYTEEMQKAYESKTKVIQRMDKALKDMEFKVHYQPKIDFSNMRVCGAEALIRWLPKDGGTIFPDEFIPVFEENGFIVKLDLYVFEEVCRFIKYNRKKFKIPMISVNLSGATLMNFDVANELRMIMKKHEISPEMIELEITESAFVSDASVLIAKLSLIKSLGVSIAMDDFGVGESSFNRLSNLDIDVLKLDKAFLSDNCIFTKGAVVVESLVSMARQLNLHTVAEGIETEEQMIWLKNMGCSIGQGYYFSRPQSEEAFIEFLSTQPQE